MNSGLTIPIVLQTLAVVVIIAEIIIPSGGILSVAALGLLGYSLYHVFANQTAMTGMVFVVIDVITIPVLVIVGLKMLSRSPAALRKTLSSSAGVQSQSDDLERYLNAEGTAATDLRPAGKAVIDGARLDVVTRGDYIEQNEAVVVSAIEGNQIIVMKKSS